MGRSNYTRTKRKSTRAHAKRKSIRTRAHAKRKSTHAKRKSTRRQQNGGQNTILPGDIVKMTRTVYWKVGGAMDAINGAELAAHPGPTRGQFPFSR